MATKRVFDSRNQNLKSQLISALNSLPDINNFSVPDGQFGFNAIIETNNTKLSNDTIDFEYTIPFDYDSIPNESEIVLYNLSDGTIGNLRKGNMLSVTAGYGLDMGIILTGRISEVKTRHEECDKITTVYVLDNVDYAEYIVEEVFPENTKASEILNWLLLSLGPPIEVFKVQRDHIYESETTVKGSITENIKTYADVCGVSVYVNKQRIYCRPIWDGDNLNFTISPETGMIDSPEAFEESNTSEEYKDTVIGYNISMIAQHRMTTAAIVDVSAKDCAGTFRVCSGTHEYDGLSATTTIKCIADISTEIIPQETSSVSSSASVISGGGIIDKAAQWAIVTANDDTHGYDQNDRWGPDYDCSSFVISAYQAAGLSLSSATYTGNMYNAFINEGFEDVTSSCNLSTGAGLKKGDVLLNVEHHTEIVVEDGGRKAGAHIAENGSVCAGQQGDQTGGEISITDYSNYTYGYDYVLRYSKDDAETDYTTSSNGNWITGWKAATYGDTYEDDNGICGWNGLNYHNISGCHVAIPTYCVKQADCYNSIWAQEDYPELANGYGTVLEVRSPDTGKTVKAVVADCGNFGKHNTYNHDSALDLPPNTYTALGLSPGKYDIEYRVVGSVSSWSGEQV